MYPFIRMAASVFKHRKGGEFAMTDTLESQHICWPWDLDMWMELNNGRSLTLYDLGRVPLAMRTGLGKTLMDRKWLMTMAGVTVRWRRRVRMFDRVTMKSRALCWDDKFFYIEQSMWLKNGECASHVLYRVAVTDKNGIVRPPRVAEAMGITDPSPTPPDWVQAWITAENLRPWPPMQDAG